MKLWFKTSNSPWNNMIASLASGVSPILTMRTSGNSLALLTKLLKREDTSFFLSQCWKMVSNKSSDSKNVLYSKWSLEMTNTIPNCLMSSAIMISRGTNLKRKVG